MAGIDGAISRWKLPIRLWAILTFALWPIHDLNAQTTTSGGLGGVVTGASQAVVPDAAVEIKDNTKEQANQQKPIATEFISAFRYQCAVGRGTVSNAQAIGHSARSQGS